MEFNGIEYRDFKHICEIYSLVDTNQLRKLWEYLKLQVEHPQHSTTKDCDRTMIMTFGDGISAERWRIIMNGHLYKVLPWKLGDNIPNFKL